MMAAFSPICFRETFFITAITKSNRFLQEMLQQISRQYQNKTPLGKVIHAGFCYEMSILMTLLTE
jgi:hypothetical protein